MNGADRRYIFTLGWILRFGFIGSGKYEKVQDFGSNFRHAFLVTNDPRLGSKNKKEI